MKPKKLEKYVCPDCGWRLETATYRIRCGNCGSLNLERQLPNGQMIKADMAQKSKIIPGGKIK
jgi:DNA-directed RNA polymerase subunit RPC12/RpoP